MGGSPFLTLPTETGSGDYMVQRPTIKTNINDKNPTTNPIKKKKAKDNKMIPNDNLVDR